MRLAAVVLCQLALAACKPFPGLVSAEGGPDPDLRVDGRDACPQGYVGDGITCLARGWIYRSVGPGNTDPLADGAGNSLVVSGWTATFARPLPDEVGVGDVLAYDSSGDGSVDALAFIHGRTSSSSYAVASESGGAPAQASAAEAWTLYRAYTSLALAVTGTPNLAVPLPFDDWTGGRDLVAPEEVWNIACYADAPETSLARIEGWTTSPGHYLRIFTPVAPSAVGVSQRHVGVWDSARYHIETPAGSDDRALLVSGASVRIEGLQIFANMDGPGGGLTFGVDLRGYTTEPATAHLSHNIIKSKPVGSSTSYSRGIKIAPGSGLTAYIWNNIIYGFGDDAAKGYGIEFANGPGGGAAYVYNNTVCSCYAGVVVNTGEMAAKNNVVLQSMREDLGGAAILMGSNNKTGDGSAAQAGLGAQLSSDVPADYFISGSDFHIDPAAKHAAELMDAGLDLSKDSKLPFTTDIEGLTRGAKWDIGASEHAP